MPIRDSVIFNKSNVKTKINEESFGLSTENSTSKTPIVNVKIMNKVFPAILDSGSSISLVGSEIIALIGFFNVPIKNSYKSITWGTGISQSNEIVTLTVDWKGGKVKQVFVLIPNLSRPLIGS